MLWVSSFLQNLFLEGERQSRDSRSFFFYLCKNYDYSNQSCTGITYAYTAIRK